MKKLLIGLWILSSLQVFADDHTVYSKNRKCKCVGDANQAELWTYGGGPWNRNWEDSFYSDFGGDALRRCVKKFDSRKFRYSCN